MTQQDIVNQLNRLVVGYNITWEDIKYDADRAIMNINNRLGAKFPMMSQILVGSNVGYELDTVEGNIPIIQDQYIHTVIIPFIASEILARDEEFTTIYNKYLMDYENGLFDMFQYEFNRIPLAFRQSKDVGVFFGYDTPQRKVHDTIEKNLPLFKFKIYYHLNADYDAPDNFTFDNNLYDYGTNITVKAPTITKFIKDHYLYTFSHWSTNPDDTNIKKYNAGDIITNINGTIHLYAIWNIVSLIKVNNSGRATMRTFEDPVEMDTLIIPTRIDGIVVTSIGNNFFSTNKVKHIVLPQTLSTIKSGAFSIYNKLDAQTIRINCDTNTFNNLHSETQYTNIQLPSRYSGIVDNSSASKSQWQFKQGTTTKIFVDAGCTLKIGYHYSYGFYTIINGVKELQNSGTLEFTSNNATHVELYMENNASYLYYIELTYNVTVHPINYLESITIPQFDFLLNNPKIKIETRAIYTENMPTLYIPYSVFEIEAAAICGVPDIKCQRFINEKPLAWKDLWTDTGSNDIEWGVING